MHGKMDVVVGNMKKKAVSRYEKPLFYVRVFVMGMVRVEELLYTREKGENKLLRV